MFQSTPPGGGDRRQSAELAASVSIHAPPEGATIAAAYAMCGSRFNPRPPGGGRHASTGCSSRCVSIHAPPEGATLRCARSAADRCFNPRPPGGGDRPQPVPTRPTARFQSTPPRRGRPVARVTCGLQFQSTPPRRRATSRRSGSLGIAVSIHAPPEEGDARGIVPAPANRFQSTPPWRRATRRWRRSLVSSRFNPRPPGGGRPTVNAESARMFQSTPPRRGRLLRGVPAAACFNPRPPGGGRRGAFGCPVMPVSIHAPPEEGDRRLSQRDACRVSIHAPPEEGDMARDRRHPASDCFNPRPPGGGRRK